MHPIKPKTPSGLEAIKEREQKRMAKILIVEDESKIARFVELELKHEGYEVEIASDGRTGLEKALSGSVDLVVFKSYSYFLIHFYFILNVCKDTIFNA